MPASASSESKLLKRIMNRVGRAKSPKDSDSVHFSGPACRQIAHCQNWVVCRFEGENIHGILKKKMRKGIQVSQQTVWFFSNYLGTSSKFSFISDHLEEVKLAERLCVCLKQISAMPVKIMPAAIGLPLWQILFGKSCFDGLSL